MIRKSVLTCLALLVVLPLHADEPNRCYLEDWRYSHVPRINWIKIEGATSCLDGEIIIRVYNGNKLLGVVEATINGYAFSALMSHVPTPPLALEIRYVIQ